MTTIAIGDGKIYADKRLTVSGPLINHFTMNASSTIIADAASKIYVPKVSLKAGIGDQDVKVKCLGFAGDVDVITSTVNYIEAYGNDLTIGYIWEKFFHARGGDYLDVHFVGLLEDGRIIVGGLGDVSDPSVDKDDLIIATPESRFVIGSGSDAVPDTKRLKESSVYQRFLVGAYLDSSSSMLHDVYDLASDKITSGITPNEEDVIEAFKFLEVEGLYKGPKHNIC